MFAYTPPPGLHSFPSQFGNVTAGNYAEFDANGFLTFYGAARAYLDFNFDVAQLRSGASAPDLIQFGSTGIDISGFDGNATLEQVDFGLELQHNWAEGTVIQPHVHWYPSTAGAGNVIWYLEYSFTNASDAVAGASSLTINTGAITAGGVAWANHFTNFPAINLPSLTIGTQAHFKFYRNPTGSDTYGDDAAVATVGLHVILNTLGSRGISTK